MAIEWTSVRAYEDIRYEIAPRRAGDPPRIVASNARISLAVTADAGNSKKSGSRSL